MRNKRHDIATILAGKDSRRRLMTAIIIATQAREEIVTSQAQAEAAYDTVQQEKATMTVTSRPLTALESLAHRTVAQRDQEDLRRLHILLAAEITAHPVKVSRATATKEQFDDYAALIKALGQVVEARS